MKHNYLCALFVFVVLVSCENKSYTEDESVTIIVGKESRTNAATVVNVCRGLIRDGVNPDKILIKCSNSENSIRLSSESGVQPGSLQELFGPGKYEGQIVLLRRIGQTKLYSGPLKDTFWYIVDESLPIDSLIKTVSSKPSAVYILCDVGLFRENLADITVPIDFKWPDN